MSLSRPGTWGPLPWMPCIWLQLLRNGSSLITAFSCLPGTRCVKSSVAMPYYCALYTVIPDSRQQCMRLKPVQMYGTWNCYGQWKRLAVRVQDDTPLHPLPFVCLRLACGCLCGAHTYDFFGMLWHVIRPTDTISNILCKIVMFRHSFFS